MKRIPILIRGALAASLALGAVTAWAADDRFTIAVIPDTQNYVDYTHQKAEGFPFDAREMFIEQLQYVADNAASKGGDIAFLSALGDVWQHQTLEIDPSHAKRGFKAVPGTSFARHFAPSPKVRTVEMPNARMGYQIINNTMPFSVVPGNHDYDAMWVDSKFPPAEKADITNPASFGMLHPGGLDNFRSVFGAGSEFFKDKPWYVASHDGGADSAQMFTAGGYRFLHIGLQFDAPNASLDWAAQVIAQHPGLPTIVTMHDYMDKEARRIPNPIIDAHAADPTVDNTPQMIWDKLLSQHDQIFLVLCGHEHGQAFRTDANKFGNKVHQVLADYQDRAQTARDAGVTTPHLGIGDGWLRLMRFDMDGDVPTIKVETYSSRLRKFSRDTAQYAAWYKQQEKPTLSDAAFHGEDNFTIFLDDFRKRFGPPAKP